MQVLSNPIIPQGIHICGLSPQFSSPCTWVNISQTDINSFPGSRHGLNGSYTFPFNFVPSRVVDVVCMLLGVESYYD